jgi:hypothetical protein
MLAERNLSVATSNFEHVIDQRRPEAESSLKPSGPDINALLSMMVEELDEVGTVAAVTAVHRAQTMLDGLRVRLLEHLPRVCADEESATSLLAGIEKISRAKATGELALARNLRLRLPCAFAALESGDLGFGRVAQLVRATSSLALDRCVEVDAELLPAACEKTPSQLAHLIRRAVAKADPAGAARRSERRKAERQVSAGRSVGGLSWLHVLLDAEDTLAACKRVENIAQEIRSAGDLRTMNQLRADAVRDLLLGKNTSRSTTQVYAPPTGVRRVPEQTGETVEVPAQRGGSHRSGRTPPSRSKAGRRGSRKNRAGRGR